MKKLAPSAHQVATYGHIAAVMRAHLAKDGNTMQDLCEAIGKPRGWTSGYGWLGSRCAPSDDIRPAVARVLGVPEAALMPNREAWPGERRSVALTERVQGSAALVPERVNRATEALGFSVDSEGIAELRLRAREIGRAHV